MQVAIITGGGAGMGFAVAQRLAQEGWFTVIVDVNGDQGQRTVEKLGNNAVFKKANVTIYSEQSSVFEETFIEYGRVDFVFANAGIAGKADFYDIVNYWPPEAPSMTVQDVNLTGVVYSAYLAMHYMRRNTKPGGVLVMTASAASIYSSPDLPLYTAAKHGVLGLMRSMSERLRQDGIRVNCILPGAIRTTLHSADTWSQFGTRDFTPIEEVVSAIMDLVHDPNATGRAMEISAGEVFDRKQPEYCNDTMARIMRGISYKAYE